MGYSLFLSLVREPQHQDHQRILDTLLSRRVDGIIWAVPEVGDNHKWLAQNRMRQLPPVVFLSMAPLPGFTVVEVDNRGGAQQAVQHLIDRGRCRMGLVIPVGFSRELQAGRQAKVGLLVDGSNSTTAMPAHERFSGTSS